MTDAKDVTRYEMEWVEGTLDPTVSIEPAPHGEWVRYADILDHIATLTQECADRAACEASLTEWNEQLTQQRDDARRDAERYSAMLESIVEGYDWWTVDEYDRCMTHGVRNPIDDARTLLAARTADAGESE